MEFEIGIGKTARRAYGFDEVAIVPSRRTRDPEDVNIAWEIDAYTFASADDGARDGRGGLTGHARSRSAGWAASRVSTSRGCGPGTRTRTDLRRDRRPPG
jgi:hypothetical protein